MTSSGSQLELTLPAPPARADTPLVPARMVNEHVYCPRLAWLEWAAGDWADTADTVKGRAVHTKVDQPAGALPEAEGLAEAEPLKTRALTLSSERLGLIAKLDLLEAADGAVTIIDYKQGKRPHTAAGAHDPERVQLCAQALVLEDNGYTVAEAYLWFAASRERVPVPLTEELRALTARAISELRLAASLSKPPPPLENSRKCVKCSLAGICLPDEVNYFRKGLPPRPLNPADDTALPLYVQEPGARVRKSGEQLIVETEEGKTDVPLIDVSQLAVFGPVNITTPTVHELMRRDIPITYLSSGGWFLGHSMPVGGRNADLRAAQFRVAFDVGACLRFAQSLVQAKLKNQRSFLRRNWKAEDTRPERDEALAVLKRCAERAETAPDLQTLLGREGEGAAVYFRHFTAMLSASGSVPAFDFQNRNRRPPADPVNALLSLGYALLTRQITVSLSAVGLDPYRGFYHQPRFGRPALALDLMEPLRPVLADSTVIGVINNGEIKPEDFTFSGGASALKPRARKTFIAAFERRLDQEQTHPLFGYRITMRRMLEVQARLLGRYLLGEIDTYPHYTPR